jgi:hypothetical protein
MPANTYEPIATTTLTSATSTVTFGSIPQTYTDLVLVTTVAVPTDGYFKLLLNSDTGTNYSRTTFYGGGTATSNRNTNEVAWYIDADTTLTNGLTATSHIMNYSNSTTFKSCLYQFNAPAVYALISARLWRNTAAITSLTCSQVGSSTFSTGSIFTLYGIKAA